MNIYVQSRGYDQHQDYCWLEVERSGKINPQIPPLSQITINLIQGDSRSIVLERLADRRLLLMITALEPDQRKDIFDRNISIQIAWVAEDNQETEFFFRQMAAFALRDENWECLTQKIDRAVVFLKDRKSSQLLSQFQDNQYGFSPNFNDLKRLIFGENITTISESKYPDLTKKVGKNLSSLRNELANELQECYLPKEQEILVIVTGFKKRETLENAGVWRALSKLIDGDRWEAIEVINKDELNWQVSFKDLISLPINMFNPILKLWNFFFNLFEENNK